MSKERLSQQKLLEILTEEIESLKDTTERIHNAAPELDKKLKQVQNNQVKVDTTELVKTLTDHEKKMKKNTTLPNWIIGALIGLALIAGGATYYGYDQHQKAEKMETEANYFYHKLDSIQSQR